MARRSDLLKKTANLLLDHLRSSFEPGRGLPTEAHIARMFAVSRSTVRAVLTHLGERKIIRKDGNGRVILRRPRASDYFPVHELDTRSEHIETIFRQKVLSGDFNAGQKFSEAELARAAGVGTATVREFLIRHSRFGIVEKRPRSGWTLHAFDPKFINELADIRLLLETAAIRRFEDLSNGHKAWMDIAALENEHRRLIGAANRGYEQFRQVDSAFHSTIIRQLNNRFVNEVHEAVTFAFHFHRRRSDKDEFERSTRAIREHLQILGALLARDFTGAELHLTWHLATSRRTLLQSVVGSSHRNRRRPVLSAQPSLS